MGLAVVGCGNGGTKVGHGCTNGQQWTGAAMGDGTATHAAGQAEAGHGTVVETAVLRQSAATAHGKGGWGGRKKWNEDECRPAPPPPTPLPPPLFINQLDN